MIGPHALACAARLSGCRAALSVAGVAPYDAEGLDYLAGQGQDSECYLAMRLAKRMLIVSTTDIDETMASLEGEESLQKFCAAQRVDMINADIAAVIEAMSSLLPAVDKDALLNSAEMGQYMTDSMNESLKTNSDGWVDDGLAFVTPWGFELSEIKVPVLLYQGDEDKMVPFSHGQWLAAHLPQEKLTKHLIQGQGHISIFVGQSESILDELLKIGGFA